MTKYQVLLECFKALPAQQRANLREHARRRTPVLCGELGSHYVNEGVG